MNKFFLFISFIFPTLIFPQTEDAWIFFKDKPQADEYLSNPLSMLSQRALNRRSRYNIKIDKIDVPIDANYLNQIKNINEITYIAKSKWMNAVHVQGSQENIKKTKQLYFVDHIEFANKNIEENIKSSTNNFHAITTKRKEKDIDYGYGYTQIHQLNGEIMHYKNFTGKGVLVAIIDAGFLNVNTANIFQSLFQNNRIKDMYNFVNHDNNIYQYSIHGSGVLSTIVANSSGELIGTAPDIDVALYISEDISQETPIEETYWTEAAERADSLGVDLINTSLGYQTYDKNEYSYTMNDLDGQTSFISRAANIAVTRGISVIVSCGNSGEKSWYKIGMPADAQNVISVGSVNENGERSYFSSIGPTADERIKPEIMAMGENVAAYWNDNIEMVSGTSFSAPIITGMIACMIQAFPQKTPNQLKQDLINICNHHNNPNNESGYGIPNFSLYDTTNHLHQNKKTNISMYPNPATTFIYLSKRTTYQIYSQYGQLIISESNQKKQIDVRKLSAGIYYLTTENTFNKFIIK